MNLAQISSSVIFITTITILTTKGLIDVKPTLAYHVIPVHCDIQLTALLSNDSCNESKKGNECILFEGTTGIIINILHSTNSIKFHTLNIHINQQSVQLIETNGIVHYLNEILYSSEENVPKFYFYELLSPGFYTLKINSTSCITEYDTGLFFGSDYLKRNNNLIWLVTPHNQMTGTCQLFPCWNERQLKNTFTISIKHDSDFMALSNMPIRIQYTSTNNDSTWTIFHTTPPISIYKISIIVTNFPSIRINAKITLWCEKCRKLRLSLKYAKQIIKNITLHLESQFDEIEIPKIDHVLIPNFPDNSISKWGLIFHREADLIYDEISDPVMRKIEITRSIASKIAYQWFGNADIPICWFSFRLNNGLATLFGEEITIKIFNNSQLMDFFIVRSQYDFLLLDFNINILQINSPSQIYSIFNFLSYTKVPAVLWVLQNIVTDVAFRKNVCAYLHKHTFISIITDKFWFIQENVVNAPYQYFKSNDFLTWIMYNRHCPILNLEQKNSFFRDLMQYFNTMDDGYYELSKNWHNYSAHLDIEEYKNLSVFNRAKITNVAFHLMMLGQLNVSTFWNVTKYSSQEIDYSVWYPMIKIFEFISSVFPLSKEEVNFILIKEKIRELLSTSLEILGFDERPMENDLTKCLRQEIAKWACIVEHSECLLKAKFKLEQHLEHPKLYKILPGWKRWTYCKGLMMVDSPSWSYLRHIWSNKPNRKYVEFLTCFQNNYFLNMLFKFLELENLEKSRRNATKEDINTCIKIFHSVVANYAKNDYALDVILLSFIYIKPIEISITAALVDIINHVYSVKQLNKLIRDILEYDKVVHLGGLASKVYSKIETRCSEIERQINYFRMILS